LQVNSPWQRRFLCREIRLTPNIRWRGHLRHFGSRRMVLRDVLALSAGAVVELDRSLQAPVDLLLDGRVIAQGEVVVVDGKYGLRVTGVAGLDSAS
jgi:flagellar motor switch protein FliN